MKKTDELPEYAHQRIDKLQNRNAQLEATLKATRKPDPLLVELQLALLTAQEASHPLKSTPIDPTSHRRSANRPDPGASTRAARRAERTLRTKIREALDNFQRSAEHHWHPPAIPGTPKVKCVLPNCDNYNTPIPKYVGPRGARIELFRCPKCDAEMKEA